MSKQYTNRQKAKNAELLALRFPIAFFRLKDGLSTKKLYFIRLFAKMHDEGSAFSQDEIHAGFTKLYRKFTIKK